MTVCVVRVRVRVDLEGKEVVPIFLETALGVCRRNAPVFGALATSLSATLPTID